MHQLPVHHPNLANNSSIKKRFASIAAAKPSRLVRKIEKICFQTWWVVLFLLVCYAAYEHALVKYEKEYQTLHNRLEELQLEKKRVLAKQEDLQLQINSHSDPSWIERTLIKGLGVVPEGYKKIYFAPQID